MNRQLHVLISSPETMSPSNNALRSNNPLMKDVVSFDELNGNRGGELLEQEALAYNSNAKRASEPAVMTGSRDAMIDEEDEGMVNEQEVEEDEEVIAMDDSVVSSTTDDSHLQHEDVVDEENNSSKLLQDSDGMKVKFLRKCVKSNFCFSFAVMENSFSTPSKHENIPDWVVVGESVQIRPYNTSGVISFVGGTHFQVRTDLLTNEINT